MENNELLLCDFNETPVIGNAVHARSSLACFDAALSGRWRQIILSFCNTAIHQRGELIDLCAALRHHEAIEKLPFLVLLPAPHRLVLEQLCRIDLIYVRYTIDTSMVTEEDSVRYHAHRCCSFLNYIQYDEYREMVVCGAYRNRLVLGLQKQFDFCSTDAHMNCKYYLHPRNTIV